VNLLSAGAHSNLLPERNWPPIVFYGWSRSLLSFSLFRYLVYQRPSHSLPAIFRCMLDTHDYQHLVPCYFNPRLRNLRYPPAVRTCTYRPKEWRIICWYLRIPVYSVSQLAGLHALNCLLVDNPLSMKPVCLSVYNPRSTSC
jgi:hypothetical protein